MASAAIDIVANVHLPLPLGKQGVLLFLSCALLVISLGLPSWEMVFQSANLQKNHLFDVMFSIIKLLCYYGVRLLVLAAKWSPQAFLGG